MLKLKPNKSDQNLQDCLFILNQINTLNDSASEIYKTIKNKPSEGLFHLRHPEGKGIIICGHEAYFRFKTVASRYLEGFVKQAGSTEVSGFAEILRDEFASRYIKLGQQMNRATVSRLLDSAYQKLQEKYESLIHFIPCSVIASDNPNEFQIGPVLFLHKTRFWELYGNKIEEQKEKDIEDQILRNKQALERGIAPKMIPSEDRAREIIIKGYSKLRVFFDQYSWVAIVTVETSHPGISRQRAMFAVQSAINVLKLFCNTIYSEKMRIAYTPMLPTSDVKLVQSAGGPLRLDLAWISREGHTSMNWVQALYDHEGTTVDLAGNAIRVLIDSSLKWPLSQRFLDALSWFSDAMDEISPAGKVIKYVSAIERMTVTGKEFRDRVKRPITDIFSPRATLLCYHLMQGTLTDWYKRLSDIYALRSDLLHGSLSPFDEKVRESVSDAEELASIVLISGLHWFQELGIDDAQFNDKRLREKFLVLEKQICPYYKSCTNTENVCLF